MNIPSFLLISVCHDTFKYLGQDVTVDKVSALHSHRHISKDLEIYTCLVTL